MVAAFADRGRTAALSAAPLPGLVPPGVFCGEKRRTKPSNNRISHEPTDERNAQTQHNPCQQSATKTNARPSLSFKKDPLTPGRN